MYRKTAPALHLKLYIYGYLNRTQSSRRLERECQRNLEVMWLPDGLLQTPRRLQISARTVAQRSRRYVLGSSSSAARWAYWWQRVRARRAAKRCAGGVCGRARQDRERHRPGQWPIYSSAGHRVVEAWSERPDHVSPCARRRHRQDEG